MSRPAVTVIVPFYNAQATLAETLQSLTAQTLPDWECVLVDDGSVDGSAEIAARAVQADARCRLIRTGNRGQSSARNAGLQSARGRYIQFLDADDLLGPAKLARQVEAGDGRGTSCITYSNCRYFVDEPSSTMQAHLWVPFEPSVATSLFCEKNPIPISAPLVPAALAGKVGGFDEGLLMEDWDYWIRCILNGAVWSYVDAVGCDTLIRQRRGSSSCDVRRMLRSEVAVYRKHAAHPPFRNYFRRKVAFHGKALVASLLRGGFASSKNHLFYLQCAIRQK